MPLLRKKPFVRLPAPQNLKSNDEVFYCELTNEAFTDYEVFYQRMILCNSLVWSCEYTLKPNLTFKEAQESEEAVIESLRSFPEQLKYAVLMLVHHTKRTNLKSIVDDIFEFIKNRYQKTEDVEVKIKDKWYDAVVTEVPSSCDVNLLKKNTETKLSSPLKTPNKEKNSDRINHNSPIGHKEQWPDAMTLEYTVELLSGNNKGSNVELKGKQIRRPKNTFTKEKMKLYMKQTCMRTTPSSDDGYWVVLNKEVEAFSLGLSSISPSEVVYKSPSKKKKKKRSKSEIAKRDKSDFFAKAKHKKEGSKVKKELTEEEKKKQVEEEREKRKFDLEQLRVQKIKDREGERERKRNLLRKEKEYQLDLKICESTFLKEYSKHREDLKLEDSKPLPTFVPFKCPVNQDLVGDVIMVVEFTNVFGTLFDLENEIDAKVSFDWLIEALTEHDAEGKYYQILKFLLHSYLRVERDENSSMYYEKKQEKESSSDEEAEEQPVQQQIINITDFSSKAASSNARAAAAWSMLYQGMALHEITIEPYTLTEILRLHISSSGVRIGGVRDYNEWARRGQAQMADDPCVWFRHKEFDIMSKLSTSSVFDLNSEDKLKLLVLLVNQSLTLATTRDYIEESLDKLKEIRKSMRELFFEENKRKKQVAHDKWKKTIAERKKLREEKEKRKQEKTEKGTATSIPQVEETKKSEEIDSKDIDLDSEEINSNENENPKTEKELQEERKQKKDAKEQKIEDFYVDKYKFNEQQLINEMEKHKMVVKETPIGTDRIFRNYWNFPHVDGFFVDNENGGDTAIKITDELEKDCGFEDISEEEIESGDEEDSQKKSKKITFEEIISTRENNAEQLKELVFKRYKCNYDEKSKEFIDNSSVIKSILIDIESGMDPSVYSAKDSNMWYSISNIDQFNALLTSLNSRGIRENTLKAKFDTTKENIYDYFAKLEANKDKPAKKVYEKKSKKSDPNVIDKSLFKTMDDFIEGNLRDQLLEFEERLYIASFGGIHSVARLAWRSTIEESMANLIQTPNSSQNIPNGSASEESEMDIDKVDEKLSNGHVSQEMGEDKTCVKALPLHMQDENVKEHSRCSTPVLESSKNPVVYELAESLLQIARDIEMKYLKPPLGENEAIKRERVKELIENKVTEEEKKTSSLVRWEESLMKCSSFSQIFVHLNTLDRSVIWDKSVQNVKCRKCKRKGNEERMLLCDGCDRGFHMDCLTPPLKKIPQADWFCNDCRPIEVKQRRKKVSICEQDDTEEEDDKEEEGEKEEGSGEEGSEEEESGNESEEGSDDDSDDDDDEESEAESEASHHGESCTVCDEEGTLILCESCPRSYHIECVYPPIRKVPRGRWFCQICNGADAELTYKRRAITLERKRIKAEQEQEGNKRRGQQRGQPEPIRKKAAVKRTQKSPPARPPSKRAKLDSDSQGSSQSSQRSGGGFDRQQLKNCSTLLADVFKKPEAELFLRPVDINEVPDYTQFIDNPMDFGTIKQNLNTGKYSDLQQFSDDMNLIFSNCDAYNPPRSQVSKDCLKVKNFVKRRMKELDLG